MMWPPVAIRRRRQEVGQAQRWRHLVHRHGSNLLGGRRSFACPYAGLRTPQPRGRWPAGPLPRGRYDPFRTASLELSVLLSLCREIQRNQLVTLQCQFEMQDT
jgi:hypothetical protein